MPWRTQAAVQGAARQLGQVLAPAAEHVVQRQERATAQFPTPIASSTAVGAAVRREPGPIGASAVSVAPAPFGDGLRVQPILGGPGRGCFLSTLGGRLEGAASCGRCREVLLPSGMLPLAGETCPTTRRDRTPRWPPSSVTRAVTRSEANHEDGCPRTVFMEGGAERPDDGCIGWRHKVQQTHSTCATARIGDPSRPWKLSGNAISVNASGTWSRRASDSTTTISAGLPSKMWWTS